MSNSHFRIFVLVAESVFPAQYEDKKDVKVDKEHLLNLYIGIDNFIIPFHLFILSL